MNDFDERQARREVQQLHQLAMDAHKEDQYATMERLLEHAVSVAQQLDDLPLLIEERFWLATAQRMQGKYMQTLATFSWLIGLANDPASSQLLTDPDSLKYLEGGFRNFIECGRFLPEMPVERLLRVVADGLDWLERVGKAHWAAGLRYQKGRLLKNRGDWEEARSELEAALALARRHPEAPGYTLATYQLELADLLRKNPFKAYAEAISLAEEALSAPTSGVYARRRAYTTLAYVRLEMGEYEEALNAAQQPLLLAQAMESPSPIAQAYELLGRVHRERGHVAEAAQAVAQEWRWSRRDGSVEYCYYALINCARVRNLQARAACGLPAKWGALPGQIPAEAQVALALRRVRSVLRFVQWAMPLAVQLDRASGRRSSQEDLDYQLQVARELERWLTQKENM